MKEPNKSAAALIEVMLVKEHTDASELLAPGTKLKVNPTVAQWLVEQGVAKTTTKEPK